MSSLVNPANVGDRELGSVVAIVFNTVDSTGLPASISGAAFLVRELQTKSVYSGAQIEPEVDVSGVTGLHKIAVDTNHVFFREGVDYSIEFVTGTVDGINQAGMVAGTFSIGAQSDGLVLRRAVKCHSGQVTAVTSHREFDIDFIGVEDSQDDYYQTQEFVFQSGGNAGVGRVCLTYDASNQRVVVQEAYPVMPEVGAKFIIIPHERELRVYTGHIECEWGIGQAVGDRISVTLFVDGNAETDPNNLVTSMTLQTWDVDSDAAITNESLTANVNSAIYHHQTSPGDARKQNEGLAIRATFQIEGLTYIFQRTIYNYA